MLLNVKRTVFLILLIGIALLGMEAPAYAEQMNNSVKDWIESPESNDENQLPKKEEKQEKQDKDDKQDKEASSTVGLNTWDFIKMIFATIFVIALLYFMLKYINKKSKSFKSTQLVENLGGTALGTNRSVQLIKVGNRILVVGVGENIQLLKEINDSEECSQIIAEYNEKIEQLVQPSDIVTKVLQRTKGVKTNKQKGNQFQTVLKQQLEDITKDRKKLYDEMEKKGTDER